MILQSKGQEGIWKGLRSEGKTAEERLMKGKGLRTERNSTEEGPKTERKDLGEGNLLKKGK